VVANPRRRVAVVKFQNVRTAFPGGRRMFAFNDPLIEGVVFESIDDRVTWAKIRLRTPQVLVEAVAELPAGSVAVALREALPPAGIQLIGVRLTREGGSSRVVLDLEQLPQYDLQQIESFYVIRLNGVAPIQGLTVQGEDDLLQLFSAEADGQDTLLRILMKAPGRPTPSVLTDPARLVFDFAPTALAAAAPPGRAEVPAAPPPPQPQPEPLDELLEAEPNLAVRANYMLAEREYRNENYRLAGRLFQRVYLASPRSRLGVRAFFRSADSAYEMLRARGATNFHSVIGSYQAAIRSAEDIGYESELIPRAFFQIGRSYQEMGFYSEADVHYDLLQERFPGNLPYAVDSFYYRGETMLQTGRSDDAIGFFRQFLELEGEPSLEGPAFYNIGEALYGKADYASAKPEYDQARRIAPSFPDAHPLLMFHMGETYYENAEFDTARLIYRQLLDKYPDKPYTKLVALRMGDFLRDEGKEAEALEVYQRVTTDARLPIRLRGKMRIANIYAARPFGEDYRQALTLYDEVAAEGGQDLIAQEAVLRKALTFTLHNQFRVAIDTFEKLQADFPESPFLRANTVDASIEENLKGLIDSQYRAEDDWEVAKVYTRYRNDYLRNFRFKVTLYQVAAAYHRLGLYNEALVLYRQLAAEEELPLETLVAYRTAQAHSERDDLERAEESLLRFIQSYPEDLYRTDARMLLGDVYNRSRRYRDAIDAYLLIVQDFEQSQAPELGEAVSEAYYRLGEIYKELGQMKNAHDSFVDAVANFHHPIQGRQVPEYVILSHFLRGDMQFELGQDPDALVAYEDAIARYPDHPRTPWAWYQIGLIQRRNGEDVKALETFNTLVQMAETRPGELWEGLAKDNQRDLVNVLQYREYINE
ncbi:MAG: tetratricopeptide repeat protein, partial [SAR324 cluster bacterium]|nr:tetratricopeptide repeat protein [SAR324 cluster bacterium]